MSQPDGEGGGRFTGGSSLDVGEFTDRNPNAVAMDLLYLFATAFFAHLFVMGFWPAVIAAVPLGAFLYFGWNSSKPFFATQVVVVALAVAATYAGFVPL